MQVALHEQQEPVRCQGKEYLFLFPGGSISAINYLSAHEQMVCLENTNNVQPHESPQKGKQAKVIIWLSLSKAPIAFFKNGK